MNKIILENGVKLLYEYRSGKVTSFCVGFEAGANMEKGYNLGAAHAVEHMLFKGTDTMKELEINKLCDEIFGFNNAMTNYPYCIYYGTSLSSDFSIGFRLYSEIILKPSFPEEGFKEEIAIIKEELKEWKDDVVQFCEDELFFNSFNSRRIKELIIGNEKSIDSITMEEIKKFYKEFYIADNCVISVISSLKIETVLREVNKYFGGLKKRGIHKSEKLYEENKGGTYIKHRKDINGAKIQYIFPIHSLEERELKILKVFNSIFGEGTSSYLFDLIRTKNGLAYEVGSRVKNEKGIKLFTIYLSTSEKNINASLELIDKLLKAVKTSKEYFPDELIEKNIKILRLKKELKLEKSIELCKSLTIDEIMYGSSEDLHEDLFTTNSEEILQVLEKVLVNPSIQIIKPE